MQQIWNYINIYFYCLEQDINTSITHSLNNLTGLTFIFFLISGILTSINPCSISMLPIAISYINVKANSRYEKSQFLLICGNFSSFIMTIILYYVFSSYYNSFRVIIPIMTSLYIVILGLSLLKILDFSVSWFKIRDANLKSYNVTIHSYVTGFIFGLNSSTCSTPILATIVFCILHSRSPVSVILYLICYCIGYIVPLLIFINAAIKYVSVIQMKFVWHYILPIGGCFMLGTGFFSLLNLIFI